jgi:gamma-glutamyltranspeptidase/glutathione hydrolase
VLQDGGNAVDAAVTAAAVLAVVEPSMTGIGGDLFAIVYEAKTNTLHGLNASGRSPHAARLTNSRDAISRRCRHRRAVGNRTGRRRRLVRAAVEARHAVVGQRDRAGDRLRDARVCGVGDRRRLNGSRARQSLPPIGARQRRSCPADSRRRRVTSSRTRGSPPRSRDRRRRRTRGVLQRADRARDRRGHAGENGLLAERDFADHASDWIRPIATNYRGYDVYELPPNTQGFSCSRC